MKRDFEAAICKRFDVDLMGQAHWYLQSKITQAENYNVTNDQSRYIGLIVSRFLSSLPAKPTDAERKRYKAPLPYDFVATKEHCSPDKATVIALQEEFGFEYSSVIGMFI